MIQNYKSELTQLSRHDIELLGVSVEDELRVWAEFLEEKEITVE